MARILTQRQKEGLKFFIHPSANTAFEFFNQCELLFDRKDLDSKTHVSLNLGLPIQGTIDSSGHLQIVSGFEFVNFSLSELNLASCEIILHNDLSEDEIRQRSWLAVIRSLLTSLDTQRLELVRRKLNTCAPQPILDAVFGKNKLSQGQLACMAHMSRGALALQYSKQPDNQTLAPQRTSILNHLLHKEHDND